MPVSNNNFMDKLLRDVEECFKSEKNNLIEFFNRKGFDDKQSDELAFAMRRAVYYLRIDIFLKIIFICFFFINFILYKIFNVSFKLF